MTITMDAEDIKRQVDKIDLDQRGQRIDVDQEEVKRNIEKCVGLAASGKQQEAIDGLLVIEKQGRLAEDPSSTRAACTAALKVNGLWLKVDGGIFKNCVYFDMIDTCTVVFF